MYEGLTFTIDRKEQSEDDPMNTSDMCVQLYTCDCDSTIRDSWSFCPNCGAKLKFINIATPNDFAM